MLMFIMATRGGGHNGEGLVEARGSRFFERHCQCTNNYVSRDECIQKVVKLYLILNTEEGAERDSVM